MSTKEMFFLASVLAFAAFLLWLMSSVMGGWVSLTLFMGAMSVMIVTMTSVMIAVVGGVYYLTVYRSDRYAKRLREAGYSVYLMRSQILSFAIFALMALFFIPTAAWATSIVYDIHLCIQAGDCYKTNDWYYIAPLMIGVIWLIGLMGLSGAVLMWWQSFRPLRKHYNEVQRGQILDLPRLH